MIKAVYILLIVLIAVPCKNTTELDTMVNTTTEEPNPNEPIVPLVELEKDEHTLSNYTKVFTTHLHLDISVDFDSKKIYGTAIHSIENPTGMNQIIFDTKYLDILDVTLDDGEQTVFKMGSPDELLGTPLIVNITSSTEKINISYSTTEKSEALDWLIPSQTAGKQHPFMYTQGQSIFTRSWIPIQGTPAIRITYSAKVQVPDNLMAVMSASNPVAKNTTGVYEFEMPQPIPCYLLALAVGDLEFTSIDNRTGVYTEPSMLAACKYELADMGEMVTKAETLYGDYLWDRYDVIVLPPSFPFGGMENPRLTFATPTIIAGDRSLVALIAHELAHSWSGNLVTNSTWNDFWLNEGFTVYFERRIMEAMYGKDYADMLSILGYQDLQNEVESLTTDMQKLKLKLKGIHPDDAMTDIAYEKGFFFLKLIEEKVGRENFDIFLATYFNTHQFQTITTEEFLDYLNTELLEPNKVAININEWVYESGIPENCPKPISTRFENVKNSLDQFYTTNDIENSIVAKEWTTHEWLQFIRNLKEGTTPAQMQSIDEVYHLTQSGNSEIAAIWFEKSIEFGYLSIENELKVFLTKIGRRKFLVPIYSALAKTPEGKKMALEIYKEARPNYHYVSFHTIDQLLGHEEK